MMPAKQFLRRCGRRDARLQVWNPDTGKLCKDLKFQVSPSGSEKMRQKHRHRLFFTRPPPPFQAEEQFMMHDDAVLCAAISRNAEMLATASKSGQIKVQSPPTPTPTPIPPLCAPPTCHPPGVENHDRQMPAQVRAGAAPHAPHSHGGCGCMFGLV